MSTLMMCRLIVVGRSPEVGEFMQRAVARSLEPDEDRSDRFWQVRPALSFASLEAMVTPGSNEWEDSLDSGRRWLDSVHESRAGFKRARYKCDLYDADPTDLLVRVSAVWPQLAFLFVTAEPNSDWYGCDFIARGRLKQHRVPDRIRSRIRRAKYRHYRIPYPDGGGSEDGLEEFADSEADWAIMDAAEARWEPEVRMWLKRIPKRVAPRRSTMNVVARRVV